MGTAEGRGALGGRQLHTDADAGGQGMHRKGGRSRPRVRAPDLDAIEGGPAEGRRSARPDGDGALDPVRRSEGGGAARPSGCPSMPNGYHPRVRQVLPCPPASGAASHTRRRPSNARSATGSSGSGVRTATSRWASTGTGASEPLPNRSEVTRGTRSLRAARDVMSEREKWDPTSKPPATVRADYGEIDAELTRSRARTLRRGYYLTSCSPSAGPSVTGKGSACPARTAGVGRERPTRWSVPTSADAGPSRRGSTARTRP